MKTKTQEIIDLFKHLDNISNYNHKCLTASIIYSNWLEGRILYDGDHIVFKSKDGFIDEKGFYNKDTSNFLPLSEYGKQHFVEAFYEIDWSEDLYKNFLKTKING